MWLEQPPDDDTRARVFQCLQNINLDQLETIRNKTCALPFLTKLLLNPFFSKRKRVLTLIYPFQEVNHIVQLLQDKPLDPSELTNLGDSNLEYAFECGSFRDRLKIVAYEYLRIHEQARLQTNTVAATSQPHASNGTAPAKLQKSSVLDNPLYLDDVSLCLFALLNRQLNIPVINLLDMIETLLHLKHGPAYIDYLVINHPDRCFEVCQSLVCLGDNLDETAALNEISDNRTASLRAICKLCPRISFRVKALVIQQRQVPSLAILLPLDRLNQASDNLKPIEDAVNNDEIPVEKLVMPMSLYEECFENAISFITGLLQDEDEITRTWFVRFFKGSQQKRTDQSHESVLTEYRSQILVAFKRLFASFFDGEVILRLDDFRVDANEPLDSFLERRLVQAAAALRYFCCIRGIAGLKLNQDESEALLSLLTSRVEQTPTSVNFVNAAVCTLLTCPSILIGHKEDKRAADWLKWVVKDFDEPSLTDFLNTIAKHFQTNQISQISELVCSRFGMKLQIKAFLSKCKPLFTQEAFSSSLTLEKSNEDLNSQKPEVKYPAPIKDWLYSKISVYDEHLRATMVGIRAKSISSDKISELEKQFIHCFSKLYDNACLVRVIHRILLLPNEEVWSFTPSFIGNWYKVLELDNSYEFQDLIKALTKMWWKLNTINPTVLWIMTINSLRRVEPSKLYFESEYTFEDLANDPLIVLKCDSRVYRTQKMLDIVLHILSAFLEISKRCLQVQIDEHPNRQKDNRSLEELKSTLVLAQTSAAIQILLEHCTPSETESDIINKKERHQELERDEVLCLDRYNRSVDCICEHLHQVFIVDTNLAKLVHFQTYPSELLAITIEKIPSMHICLDYIPELLSQPDLAKQVFVIQLTSHLCEKYPITKSLNCAKLCFNVAYTLLQLLPSDKRAAFYIPTLPAMLRLSRVFPILQEDAKIVLDQVHQVTLAHMASTSSRLSLSSTQPFEGVDKLTWHETDKLMQGLNLDESLFLCIRKCQIELNSQTCSN